MTHLFKTSALAIALALSACGGEPGELFPEPADAGPELGSVEQAYAGVVDGTKRYGTQTNYPYRQCHTGQSANQGCRFTCTGPSCSADDTFYDPHFVIAIDNTFPTATRDWLRTILNWVVNGAGGIQGLTYQTCNGAPGPGVEPECAVFYASGNNEGDIVFTNYDFPAPHPSEVNYVARYSEPAFHSCSPELVESSAFSSNGKWRACKTTIYFDATGIHNIDPNSNSANRLRQALLHNILKATGLGQVDNASSYRNRDFKPSVWNIEPSLTAGEKCALNAFNDTENGAMSASPFCGGTGW